MAISLCVFVMCRLQGPAEPPLASAPLLGVIVIVALMWCWWEELMS